ncbi:MAG: AAA family ATPase, partial [Ktedonobacteraceae bacterium]
MSTAATLTVIETPAFLKRPDVFESANESGLFNVKVCRNCQSSILDCICDTPAEDLVPIYRNGQGTNQRFAYYLREKHTAHTAERSAYQVAIDAGKVDGFVYPDLARPAAEMRSRMKLWLRPDKHEILRALQLIQAPDSIVELRILNTPQGTWSGYYNDLHILAQDASELGELKTTPNVYVTLQSLKSNLGSSFNTTVAYSKTTTSDSDVIAYRWLPIDADPDRPSKVSSTDAEKQLTWNVVQSVRAFLTTQGIETVLADSGNGYHLLIRVDLPVAKAQLVKDLVNAFSHKFATCKEPGTGGVISDEKIFNPARIWKLYGTVARKGPNTPDRPWRMSRLLDVPADIENRPVTEEKLLELLVSMGGSITSLEAVPESPSPSAPGRVTADMILNEAARLGISLRDAGECSIGQDKGHKWQMDCVFNPMHECPDAFLFLSNGYMLFSCSHNSCKKHGTKDFCEKIHGFDFVKPIRVTLGGKDLTSVPETTREATTNSPSIPARRITMTRGDQVKPTRIKWLWKDRIVKNNISVFSGEPDRGKGLIYIDAAARITTGIDFFDSPNDLGGPRDVVILASEDDLENTIVPRLIVAGADMKRIHFCTITENIKGTDEEGLVCLDRDLDAVEETLKSYPDIVFAVLDPIIAFVGDLDSNKDKDMRPLYSRLKA